MVFHGNPQVPGQDPWKLISEKSFPASSNNVFQNHSHELRLEKLASTTRFSQNCHHTEGQNIEQPLEKTTLGIFWPGLCSEFSRYPGLMQCRRKHVMILQDETAIVLYDYDRAPWRGYSCMEDDIRFKNYKSTIAQLYDTKQC